MNGTPSAVHNALMTKLLGGIDLFDATRHLAVIKTLLR